MDNKVFVYGSLKKGLGNHRIIKRYVRRARNATMRGWMFNVGFYPAVIPGSGVVHGQLLELEHPEKAFSAMDILEGFQEPGHPRNLYERVRTSVLLDNGETEECYVYIFHDRNKSDLSDKAVFLPSGEWEGNRSLQLYFANDSCVSVVSFSAAAPDSIRIGKARLNESMEGILYLVPEEALEPLDASAGVNQAPPICRRVEISVTIDGVTLPAFAYESVAKS